MGKNSSHTFINPNALLLLCLVLMIFFGPVLAFSYHQLVYSILFSSIFILSALSLQHNRRNLLIGFAVLLTVSTWITFLIDFQILFLVSRAGQGVFFVFIVIQLIKQTAKASDVNVRVIADSINGYLLVGIIYSIVMFSFVRFQPEAFHFPEGNDGIDRADMSKMFYYTFVTYTSTGYGDILPVHPAARSFATLISVTGQLYIAIIIAMLVGKFSSIRTTTH